MQSLTGSVVQHYFRDGLFEQILDALKKRGVITVTRKDLSAFDEFHVRGAAVSAELAQEAGLQANTKLLDVGCGLGGPARMLAADVGCTVTGIDISPEFIKTATQLSALVNMQQQTVFMEADALHLPFTQAQFDVVWTQHTQMNIEDKHRFYAEIKRVLRPGGRFIYYDIFTVRHEPLTFPLPWAGDASISHLQTVAGFEEHMQLLHFKKIQTRDQTEAGIGFLTNAVKAISANENPPPGIQLVVGSNAAEKLRNLLGSLQAQQLVLQSGVYLNDLNH